MAQQMPAGAMEAKLRLCQERLLRSALRSRAVEGGLDAPASLAEFFERTGQLDGACLEMWVRFALEGRDLALLDFALLKLRAPLPEPHRLLLRICQLGWTGGADFLAAHFDARAPLKEVPRFLGLLGSVGFAMAAWLVERMFTPLPPKVTPLAILQEACGSDDPRLVRWVAERYRLKAADIHGLDRPLFLLMCRKDSPEVAKWAAEALGVELRPEEREAFFAAALEKGSAGTLSWLAGAFAFRPEALRGSAAVAAALARAPPATQAWFRAWSGAAAPAKIENRQEEPAGSGAPPGAAAAEASPRASPPGSPTSRGEAPLSELCGPCFESWLDAFANGPPPPGAPLAEIVNIALDQGRAALAARLADSAQFVAEAAAKARRTPAEALFALFAACDMPGEMRWLKEQFGIQPASPALLLRGACLGGLLGSAKFLAEEFHLPPAVVSGDAALMAALSGAAQSGDPAKQKKCAELLAWLAGGTQ
jgi:hypothetical protein